MDTTRALALLPPEEEETPPGESGAARRNCVLLAEDDREMRMLVATTLRRSGFDVVEAGDGVDLLDCLAWVIESRDDWTECVVVSDVRMPAMGGLELVARLRSMGWTGGIILITAFGDAETHSLAARLGATAVLDKPFELDALCDAIRQVQAS